MGEEFSEWCEVNTKNLPVLPVGIKSSKNDVTELVAKIRGMDLNAVTLNSKIEKIEELASAVSEDETNLRAAIELRNSKVAELKILDKEQKMRARQIPGFKPPRRELIRQPRAWQKKVARGTDIVK